MSTSFSVFEMCLFIENSALKNGRENQEDFHNSFQLK